MSNSVIGALRVNLGLDAAQFQRGVAGAQASMQSLASRMRMIGAAAAAAGVGLALAVRGQINAADEMVKTADRIGMSVEALSQLEHAASLSGVSMQTFSGAMQRLARTSVESAGELHRLGIATRTASGQMRPMEELLMEVADRLGDMPAGAERTALAIRLLGRQGAELIPMLQGGSAGLRAMMREADALGLTISTRTARAAEQFNDNLSRLGRQVTGLTRLLMASLAPALAAISDGIVVLAQNFSLLGVAAVSLAATQIPALIAALAAKTAGMGAAAIASAALTGALRVLGAAVAMAGGPWGILAAMVAGAATYFVLFRDTTSASTPIMDEAAAAIERINSVLGTSSEQMLPAAARATLNLTNENIRLAQSALAAADAELAKASAAQVYAQTELQLQQAFSPTGDHSAAMENNRQAIMRLNDAMRSVAERRAALTARINEGQLALSNATGEMAENQRRMVELTISADGLGGAMGGAAGSTEQMTEAMRQALAIIAQMNTDAVTHADVIEALRTLYAEGAISADQLAEAIRRVGDQMGGLNTAAQQVESSFESAFVNFLSGTRSARDAVAGLLQDLARLAAQAAFRTLFAGSPIFGALGGIFGGFRADGGPVAAGRSYVVGERGPELFTPSSSGQITPNHAMGGGSVTIHIDARGAVEGTAAQIDAALARRLPDIQRAAASYTVNRLNRGLPA